MKSLIQVFNFSQLTTTPIIKKTNSMLIEGQLIITLAMCW